MVKKANEYMNLDAIYVDPSEIHDYWPCVKNGAEKVAKHGEGWIAEDMYSAIKSGDAVLHLFYEGTKYMGFVVTAQTADASGNVLFVWALYSEGHNQNYHNLAVQYLESWAKSIKANRIRYHSPRKGWERVGKKIGFYPTATVFEKKVK